MPYFIRLCCFIVLLCGTWPNLSAQTVEWATRFGGTHWDESADIVVSPAGDAVFVCGMVSDTVFWQTGSSLATNGSGDFWIARYDNNGIPLWMQSGGGRTDDRFNALALSPAADAIYAAGYVRDTLVLGGDSIKTDGLFSDDPLLVKYNAQNGNLLWKQHWAGIGLASARSIGTDPTGNVYVGIVFADSIYVQTDTLAALGSSDILIVKLNADGVMQWYRQFGGVGSDVLQDIAVAPDGSLYLGGYFQQTALWGVTTLVASDENDIFMAHLDPDGNVLWANREGGEYGESIISVALNHQGQVYWAGSFNQSTQIGTYNLTSNGIGNTLLIETDLEGNIIWATQGNGTINGATSIAADNAGNAYLSGYFTENVSFGNHTLTATGSTELFAVRYSPSGEAQWLKGITANQNTDFSQAAALQIDHEGHCYVTGRYIGILNADNDELPAAGFADVFLLRIEQPLIIGIEPATVALNYLVASTNPQGQLTIRYQYPNNNQTTRLTLSNLYGQTIATQLLPPNNTNTEFATFSLPTTNLPQGLYLITLQSPSSVLASTKVWLQR